MDAIGIDLGGTKIEAVRVDGGRVVSKKRVPTPRSYEKIVSAVAGLAGELGPGRPVGVAAPGAERGGLVRLSNTGCLEGMPLRADLEAAVGAKIAMENDANCFALAEARAGAGYGYGRVFGVIMGTGVGGGIVEGGRVQRGASGGAGEWGHHALHSGGLQCHCGRRGCAEAYLSGPALERAWTGRPAPLKQICAMAGPEADAWRRRFVEDFGEGLANAVSILDPDVVVIGGGVSNAPFLYSEGQSAVHARLPEGARPPVLRNALGDSAGSLGACMLLGLDGGRRLA